MSSSTLDRPLTRSQMEALSAITDQEDQVGWIDTIPVSEYVDPARYEVEMELFRRGPTLGALSADLPEPGSYFQNEILNMPVLYTRAKDGVVRAFVNVCRHRGTQLCPEAGAQKGSRIVCPYHAWTYGLDGRLLAVPRQEAFPGMNKADYDLLELPCVEAGGLIWLGLREDAKPNYKDVTGQLEYDLDALGIGQMKIYQKKMYSLKANWKLVMDTMLDKYHVLRLHKDTLAKYFDDSPEVSDMIGPHVRSAAGRANFDKEDVGQSYESVRHTTTFGYTLFPNGMIVGSPLYVSLIIIRPIDIAHCEVDYSMLIDELVDKPEFAGKLERSWVLMDASFGKEDFWAAELGQKGINSGAMKSFVIGGMEKRLRMYHDVLNARLDAIRL